MMKIHTTQDLSVLARQQQTSTNSVSLSELRFAQGNTQKDNQGGDISATKKEQNRKLLNTALIVGGGAALTGLGIALAKNSRINKKMCVKDLKYTIRTAKEKIKVGDIADKASPEPMTILDKFITSNFFKKLLKFSENEPVMQALMAAFICIILRPATIMALPNKNGKQGKENNMYASGHSISSGIMGLVSTVLIAQPFKSGAKYTLEHLRKDMSEDALKRLYPDLDIKSIYKDADKKIRNEVSDWKFLDGNKFIPDFKDVEKIPILKNFNEISNETYKKLLKVDVDWAFQKGKSFNDVITKNGERLYDVINWEYLGIIVDKHYTGTEKLSKKIQNEYSKEAQVLLKDIDKEFLEKIIKDADKDSIWKKLDINSVYKDGKVVDFREWKELETGKQWKLDLDNTYISSALDTVMYTPRTNGKPRIESTGEIKNAAYLKNGKDGMLGSIVDEKKVEVDRKNEVYNKILTWAPDILTRPIVATATIALIPIVLKRVFHLEKAKPAQEVQNNTVTENKPANAEATNGSATSFKGVKDKDNDDKIPSNSSNISFKAKTPGGKKPLKIVQYFRNLWEKCIVKPLAKIYGKRMYESKAVDKIADKLSKVPGEMTNHMATLGALLTSSVYMYQTLHKKDLDEDRKRTLAVNQGLCFVIPTICSYTVDKLLKNWTKKNIEYSYSGREEHELAKLKLDPKRAHEVKELEKDLGQRLKGVRTLISLAIFSMIYRYITPVLITPVANKIGDNMNEKRKEKAEAEAKRVIMNTDQNKIKLEESKSVHSAA